MQPILHIDCDVMLLRNSFWQNAVHIRDVNHTMNQYRCLSHEFATGQNI